MFHQLFLAFAWAFGCVAGGILVDTCCAQKKVGGVSYTLVEKGFNTTSYGCISNCMYEKDDQPGSRFCFTYGDMEVVCGDKKESRGSDPICDEDLERLFNDTNRSGPLQFRCCNDQNKGEYTNCTDLASCSRICGGNVSCIKPVGSLDYLDQCDIDKNSRNTIGIPPALVGPSKPYCTSTTICPKSNSDPHCACCKYPDVYNKPGRCQNLCRCKATCDWFAKRGICSPRISGCCGCPDFTCGSICNSSVNPTAEPEPGTASPEETSNSNNTEDCSLVAKDCTLCANLKTCEKECKCHCICQAIIECTGVDALYPWNKCWRDYAGCCECDETKLKYKEYCPIICQKHINNTSPVAFNTSIEAGKLKLAYCDASSVSVPFGPFGNLIGADVPFDDLEYYKKGGPITKINVYTGPYAENSNVITGIQTTYGDIITPIRGMKGVLGSCAASPGQFFGQISGRARNEQDQSSYIFELAFADYTGRSLCHNAPFGNMFVGGNHFIAPPPSHQDRTLVLKYFTGKTKTTKDGMLGSLSLFINKI